MSLHQVWAKGMAVSNKLWFSGLYLYVCILSSFTQLSGMESLGKSHGLDHTQHLPLDLLACIYPNSICPKRPIIINLSYTSLACFIRSPNYHQTIHLSFYQIFTDYQTINSSRTPRSRSLSWGMEKVNSKLTTQNHFPHEDTIFLSA